MTDGDLLVFSEVDAASHDAVIVAINRGSAPATAKFAQPAEWLQDPSCTDIWNGRDVSRTGGMFESTIAPQGAAIFVSAPKRD